MCFPSVHMQKKRKPRKNHEETRHEKHHKVKNKNNLSKWFLEAHEGCSSTLSNVRRHTERVMAIFVFGAMQR